MKPATMSVGASIIQALATGTCLVCGEGFSMDVGGNRSFTPRVEIVQLSRPGDRRSRGAVGYLIVPLSF